MKYRLNVSYDLEIEVNEENFVVKEYESEKELFEDCANYRFSDVLPVINSNGVVIRENDVNSITWEKI